MSDNLYIMYLKHISEGDVAAGQEGAISPQLKNIINNASSGENGANKCMSFLNKKFGIKDVSSFCNCIKKLFTSATGAAGKFLAKIWSGVQAAMRWALKLIKKLGSINTKEDFDHAAAGNRIGFARDKILENTYKLAGLAGALGSVLIGVIRHAGKAHTILQPIKPIGKLRKSFSYREEYVNKAIIEAKAMFSDLNQLIESSHLSEGPEIRKFMDSYIQKMQPKVMELWSKVDMIARSNKVLGIVVAICAACIFSYMGMKKIMSGRKQSEVGTA